MDIGLGVAGVATALPGLVQVRLGNFSYNLEQSLQHVYLPGKYPAKGKKNIIFVRMSVKTVYILLRPS